jgi:hypothetical protein
MATRSGSRSIRRLVTSSHIGEIAKRVRARSSSVNSKTTIQPGLNLSRRAGDRRSMTAMTPTSPQEPHMYVASLNHAHADMRQRELRDDAARRRLARSAARSPRRR